MKRSALPDRRVDQPDADTLSRPRDDSAHLRAVVTGHASPGAVGAASLTFDVASVKPNKSGDQRTMIQNAAHRAIHGHQHPLRFLLRQAYRGEQDFQIVGGPNWLASDRFDIVAKAARRHDRARADTTDAARAARQRFKWSRTTNTGYDLKQAFLGAEGSLGIITAAPAAVRPAARARDPVRGRTLARGRGLPARPRQGPLRRADLQLRADGRGLRRGCRHPPSGRPQPAGDPAPWYVLAELAWSLPGGSRTPQRAGSPTHSRRGWSWTPPWPPMRRSGRCSGACARS